MNIHSINCVLVTGAGPSLLREDLVESSWIPTTLVCHSPRLKRTTNKMVESVVTIASDAQMRESRIPVMFALIRKLAVPVFLGALFINKFIKSILPTEKKDSLI